MSNITLDINEVHDEASYNVLFSKYSKLIFKLINDFVKSQNIDLHPSEVDDIYQEVAMKIFKYDYISKYKKEKSSFITWLNIICRTTAIDYYRKNLRWMEFVLGEEEALDRAEETPPAFSLPAGVLTGRQAEIITLLFRDGFSTGETAIRLDITTRTVRSLKFQALARLRAHYGAAAPPPGHEAAPETRRNAS
ncbi:sigma-70 family RNA polymerase sigma factor [Pseudodesulfovibrio sp.]|uniref:RNA polymerase sigma factor n=1 Tax=Pseudodesulfovibrio sp. TaxID=2035812 RepID=UPI002608CA43|nr:sigma-70 family RNA polymerase sigma factor [Pseudodesulfovibrio sp.]MDD3311600.1 sigma-70 family RNA polymerase sigma factor [Pseudodesulfovibrio sp.]